MEAQKALAVAARTYALVQRGKHGEYDLCDGTCCQMYLGHQPGARRGLAAVRATRHQCLWSGEELVYAFYSAHCGGVSTRIEDVPLRDKPDRPLPYLRVVRDAPARGQGYCAHSRYQQWVKRLSREELERRLNEEPITEVGKLLGVRFTELDGSGRVLSVLLRGTPLGPPALLSTATLAPAPVEKVVTGWQFRNVVGPLTLKSTLVRVGQPDAETFRFIGRGFGHGLGLCQIGADGMARARKSYRQILAHYYPGTRVGKIGS
jgi:stage II sporulation protein D